MDKNTVTGLILIGLILIGFSYFSRPSKEQIEAARHYQDSIETLQRQKAELEASQAARAAQHEKDRLAGDSAALFFSALKGEQKMVTLSNERSEVSISTKGGVVQQVLLKEYKEQDRTSPVKLFAPEDARMSYSLPTTTGKIEMGNYHFTVESATDSTAVLRMYNNANSYLEFAYLLPKGSYLVQLDIKAVGLGHLLEGNKNKLLIDWSQEIRRHERGKAFENRLSTLSYRTVDGSVEELSNTKDVEKQVEEPLRWAAFKHQFFSSVLISDAGLKGADFSSAIAHEDGYVKNYHANLYTDFDPEGEKATTLYFYYGPNHFKELSAVDKKMGKDWKLNRVIYMGMPVVRWINRYVIVNIFHWLTSAGMNMGLVLLILTLLVKLAVFPATWKTYMSSARMKVLKPKVDVINAKYPNQEDAMKKQQEIMMLYKEYGVSPMGGCLPMLFQFPILLALFMFLPSAIELRQQSFLWADDLSTYDAFINFPFRIPWLGSHLSLFCLLMTVTTILNTKYTTSMQDNGSQPQMAAMKWMMYLMPVMFLFILNEYPAGLNYYYLLSTLISVITMIAMRKYVDNDKLLAALEANKKDPKTLKKSGFAARLEALQKQQEQMQRLKEAQRKQGR